MKRAETKFPLFSFTNFNLEIGNNSISETAQ